MATLYHKPSRPRRPHIVEWKTLAGRKSRSFASRQQAQAFRAWAELQELEAASGKAAPARPPASTTPKLADAADAWFLTYRRADQTVARARIIMRMFVAHAAPMLVGNVARDDIEAHLHRVGQAPRTLRRHLDVLRLFCRWAVDRGYLGDNPCDGVTLPKPDELPPRYLTTNEYARLVAAADGETRDVIEFAANTGLRSGELIALKWSDIQGDRLTVRKAKGKRFRLVGLNADAMQVLMRRERRGPLVFCTRDGKPHIRRNLHRYVKEAGKRAGLIEPVGPHVLRHTFGSHMAMQGWSLKLIAEVMGHKSVVTTERYYAHVAPETAADIATHLDLSGSSPATSSLAFSHASTSRRRKSNF